MDWFDVIILSRSSEEVKLTNWVEVITFAGVKILLFGELHKIT